MERDRADGVSVTRQTLTLLACSVAVLAAACSSSSAASIPPPQHVEKSAAIAAGDQICSAVTVDQQRLITEFKASHPQPTPDELRDFTLNTLIPRIEQGVGDFHRIGEPTKDKFAWGKIVGRLDMDLRWFKAMAPDELVAYLTTNPFHAQWEKFDSFGFTVCGEPLK